MWGWLALKQVDRFIMGDLLRMIGFGLLLFSLVWFAPETLFKLVQAKFANHVSWLEFFQLLGLYLPSILQQTFPMACLIASVYLFRKLSQSFELTALLSSGISWARLCKPLFLVGLLVVGLHFFTQEVLIPVTSPLLQTMLVKAQLKKSNDKNFVFFERQPNANHRLEKLILMGKARPDVAHDVFWFYFHPKESMSENEQRLGVQKAQRSSRIQAIIRAKTATWYEQQQAWKLEEGVEYELDKEGIYRNVTPFATQWIGGSPYANQLLQFASRDAASLSLPELSQYLRLLKRSDQNQEMPFYQVRWHQKFALPLSNLFLLFLGALLGHEPVRSRQATGLAMAAFVLFIYLVSIPIFTNLGILKLLPAWVAGWLPLTLAILTTLLLLPVRRRSFA